MRFGYRKFRNGSRQAQGAPEGKGLGRCHGRSKPNSISTEITGKKFDLIACVSPVYEDFGIPKVKAVGMLTGLSEDKVVDDCLKILEANA